MSILDAKIKCLSSYLPSAFAIASWANVAAPGPMWPPTARKRNGGILAATLSSISTRDLRDHDSAGIQSTGR
jgi:hypothetical protein